MNGKLEHRRHDRGRTFTYDAENILRGANDLPGGASTYRYYADGTRRSKTVDSMTSEFFYWGDQEIAEKSGGQWVRRYYRLPGSVDEPFLMVDLTGPTAVNTRVHQNRQGAGLMASNDNGAIVGNERYVYDAYGNGGTTAGGFPFRYTGQKLDRGPSATPMDGLYYYKARYYDPHVGRFLQTDPIGYQDQMNLYAYAANDPVNATDPTGEQTFVCRECTSAERQRVGAAETGNITGDPNAIAVASGLNDVFNPVADLGAFVSNPSVQTAVVAALGAVPGPNVAKYAKRFSDEKAALVDMAKQDKRTGGITEGDMEAYKELNAELSDSFPEDAVRGPEAHPGRGHGSQPHGHVGPVDHIPIKPDEPE